MKSLIVFDLGETLLFYEDLALDWSEHYNGAIDSACRKCMIKVGRKNLERVSSILLKYNTRRNPRIHEIPAAEIFGEIIDEIGADRNNLSLFISESFKYFQRKAVPEKTAIELLSYLKSRRINIAVLTDVPYGMPNELVLKDLEPFKKYIDFVVTSVDAGFRKPSTQGLQMMLNKFNCKNSDAMFVGNEKKDIDSAKNLGVFSLLLCPSREIPHWNQDAAVTKLSDVKNFIDK